MLARLSPILLGVAAVLLLSSVPPARAQSLEAVYLETVLPYGFAFMPAVYDGDDSVYLLGGKYSAWHIERYILRYSITNDSMDVIGQMIDLDNNSGDGVWVRGADDSAPAGKILYTGGIDIRGFNQRSDIFEYNLGQGETAEMVTVANLPRTSSSSVSVWDSASESVYILGGFYRSFPGAVDTIYKYSLANSTVETMPARLPGARYASSAVQDTNTRVIYMFGGRVIESVYTDEILRFDPASGVVTKLDVRLPTPTGYTCAVWTGTAAYIFGGNKAAGQPVAVRFTPCVGTGTGQVETVDIDNFPVRIEGMGCAYVERLNRIYIFGGYEFEFNNYARGDQIFVIDLN